MSSNFEKFEELQREGKRLAAEGRLHESLHKFELARKIKETSKILSRIQKLKDFIGQNERKEEPAIKNEQSFGLKSSGSTDSSEKLSGILNQIQNNEVQHKNLADLTPERLKSFNALKRKGITSSYEGKFDDALRYFSEAQKLYDCPKVKKYIQDMEGLISKYPKKLEEFQNLTNTGKKLAYAGKEAESLEKLKNAYAMCPSPAVSRMIKKIEAKSSTPKAPVFSSSELGESLSRKSSEEETSSANRTVFGSSDSKENHFSSGSEVSIPSGSRNESTSANAADLSPEAKEAFKKLYSKAREQAAVGQLQDALQNLEEARKICSTEKILKRIMDLKEHMKQATLEASSDMAEVSDGFFVFHEIFRKLYPYQREGVAWMWKLFKMKKGGVLGDDMGLGKTFQVIAFLSGLIDADLIKCALIIMPVSLLPNWEKEFKKWCPGISVSLFHGASKKERERKLLKVQRRGHVLLTSYGMVLNALPLLTDYEGQSFVWDYVILDEGHKIKNPTKTTKAVHAIPSKNRLVLTGTPVQNNLLELWALYDFVHQGTLLGSLKTFKMQYENTITRAREKDSSAGEKHLGTKMAENLKMLIKPYFLRRTKAEIWKKDTKTSEAVNGLEQDMEQLRISENKLNTRKNDLIVWTFMSEAQCEIYRDFLHSEAVRTILVSKRSPLVELTTLKKICDHPRLLSQRACLQLGLNGDIEEEDLQRELNDESNYSSSIDNVTDETLMAESGKMKFLIQLLENLKKEGHRTLVFSLSRKILDMINRILINRRWKVLRIDGTISKIDERERRIQLFQKDPSYFVFLLTTQVGGVGITLTAADRVVIYDPSWNPATDAQAVDRVYRIGQQKNVIVYRLITCGTVEEKIYRRQVFKDSITKQATSSGTADPYRYFSKQELRELFTFENPHHSATQVQLSQLHSHQRLSDTHLDEHIAFLHSLDIFGISDHDLMFSREIEDSEEDHEEAAISHDYIKKQVAAAQVLIQTEASVVAEGIRLAGTYSRPFSERIPSYKKNSNSESVSQVFKTVSSADTDSKPKETVSSYLPVNYREDLHPYEKKSIIKTEINNCDLDIKEDVSVIEINSDDDDGNHQTLQISSNHSPGSLKSDDVFTQNTISNIISYPDTPPLLKNKNVDRLSDISKYTTPPSFRKSRETNASVKSSEFQQHSIHKIEVDNNDIDMNDDVYSTELNIDSKQNASVLSMEKIQSVHSSENIINVESENSLQSFCENKDQVLPNLENSIQSICETEDQVSPNLENSIQSICENQDQVSPNLENSIQSTCETEDQVSPNLENSIQSICENEDQVSPNLENSIQSICENEDQLSPNLENSIQSICENEDQVSPNLESAADASLCESLVLSESVPSKSVLASNKKSDACISNDITPPISSDSKCSSDQENEEEDSIHSQDLEASTNSAQQIGSQKLPPRESTSSQDGYSLTGLGSVSSMDVSGCSLMADLSFNDKPQISKRKSCALPTPFVASDTESSCPPSPSKENDDDVLASSDSEDDLIEEEEVLDSSCYVPSSIPNSPALREKTFYMPHSSPIRRITPLKVRKSLCPPPNQAFAQALASSPIIQPCYSSESEVDSPVKVTRTTGRRNVIESSDED